MLFTILEVPVVILYLLTRESNQTLRNLILFMNNLRKNSLKRYGRHEWVWNDYDGEQDKYVFLSHHRLMLTIAMVALVGWLLVTFMTAGILNDPLV